MDLTDLDPELLWRYYQRGYHCLMRSGLYFRQVLRPALSHVYFQRAMPLLIEYSRANRESSDLPPGFGDQMEACPLTPRDLLHLDYAICLGFAEVQSDMASGFASAPLLDWPGPSGSNSIFLAVDAAIRQQAVNSEELDDEDDDDEDEDDGGTTKPPFDL